MKEEEAIGRIEKKKYEIYSHEDELSFIKKIFNDFKNQTCDKCKFEIENGEFENNGCNGSHPIELTACDFGCNRWEKRDG